MRITDVFLAVPPLVLALAIMAVTISIMIAYGKPGWSLMLFGPLPVASMIGQFIVIPRYGSVGAAGVTTLLAVLGALIGLMIVDQSWQIRLPKITLIKTLLLSLGTYFVSAVWVAPGFLLLIKIPSLCVIVALALVMLGNVKKQEVEFIMSLVRKKADSSK